MSPTVQPSARGVAAIVVPAGIGNNGLSMLPRLKLTLPVLADKSAIAGDVDANKITAV